MLPLGCGYVRVVPSLLPPHLAHPMMQVSGFGTGQISREAELQISTGIDGDFPYQAG